MAKYRVICAGPSGEKVFWDGESLRAKDEVIEIDPDKVQVSVKSASLAPIDDAPVFDSKGNVVAKKPKA